jgi:hypothetical protein
MNQVSTFLLGIVVGAVGLYGAMHYHVVHSSDGFHVVARMAPKLTNPYVDVRKFTAADWQKNHELAMASLRANKGKIVQEPVSSPQSSIQQTGSHASVMITDKASLANW